MVGVLCLISLTSDRLTMSMIDTEAPVNLLMTAIADPVYDEGACGENGHG